MKIFAGLVVLRPFFFVHKVSEMIPGATPTGQIVNSHS